MNYLADKPTSILKTKTQFQKISNYKPSGSIYNTELIRKIENNVSEPGDQIKKFVNFFILLSRIMIIILSNFFSFLKTHCD